MKRRDFLKTTAVTGGLGAFSTVAAALPLKKENRQWYELREYIITSAAQRETIERYYRDAAIPALNRMGSKTVGVFRQYDTNEADKLFVLIPFSSADRFLAMREFLAGDKVYQAAAKEYHAVSSKNAAFKRIQSSFLRAFTQMPSILLPEKKQRLFELRRYESHSDLAAKQKIKMFNEGGEISIFKRVGLDPVFFGETLAGANVPNLTYLLVFDDMAEHDKNWKAFGNDEQWKKIKDLPEYADTVSHIERTFLIPSECSQI